MTDDRDGELEKRIEELVRERDLYKLRYDHLMKHAPTGIYEVDFNTRSFVRWNDEILDYLGYTWDEFIELSPMDILTDESKVRFMERLSRVFDDEDVPDYADYDVVTKSGEIIPVRIFPTYIRTEGVITGAMVVAKDRKEEIELERKVQLSEDKYRKLVENAHEAIFVIQDGVFRYMNKRVEDLLGYKTDEIIGKEFTSIIHPDDHESVLNHHRERLKGGGPTKPYNLRIIRKDGTLAVGEIGGVLIDWGGRPATLSFGVDVTDRVRTENLLRGSEVKFRTYTEQSLIAICILQDGVVRYANKKLSDMFGYSLEEIYSFGSFDWIETIHPDYRDMIMEKAERKKREKDWVINTIYKGYKKDGTEIWVNHFSKSIPYEGRDAEMAMLLDVTNEMEALEKLKEETRKSELYLDLLGHDIGNLHQGISNWLELARKGIDDQKRLRLALGQSSYLVKRSMKLVRNILLLSRLKSVRPELKEIDIIPMIERSIREVTNLFPERNIKVNLQIFNEEIIVMAEDILEEVFFNLIHNAVKFQTSKSPMVEIRSEISDNRIRIEIEDVGPGISDAEKRQLFTRTDRTKQGVHSGIGLSLVRELITRYEGTIKVEDTIEGDHTQGARFVVELPVIN